MKHLTWMSALIVAGTLSACDRSETADVGETIEREAEADWEASIATLRGLAAEAFSLEGGEADLAPVNDALPDLVSVSWEGKSFDAATGATTFDGLRITVATEPEFGLVAEEAKVWGLNSDLIAARLRGERLDEEGTAFNRFEARNVSYFGLAGAMNTLFDMLAHELEDEPGDDFDVHVDTFETNTAEMVMSNLSLRPYEYEPVSDDLFETMGMDVGEMSEEEIEQKEMAITALRLAQQVLAVSRSLSIEQAAAFDTTASFSMRQPGANQTAEVSWDFYGYENVEGLDIGRAVIVDMVQSQGVEMSDEDGELSQIGLDTLEYNQVEKTGFLSYDDIRLDRLAGFLARGQFPQMDQKDLLSLGTWEARDYSLQLNGGDFFEADRVRVNARDFAWFIPEDISVEMTGASIGAEEIGNFVVSVIPVDEADEEAVEFKNQLREAVDTLDEHGLETIPFDTSFEASWGEASGETRFHFSMDSDGIGEGLVLLEITLPDYEAIQAAYASDDFERSFEDAFQDVFTLRGARFYEADDGGYDKLFGYASAVGKLYPDQGWGAMLGGMDVEQMRAFIATMVRSAKGAVAQEVPQAADWLESVAAYYEASGGSIDIRVEPTRPITVEYLDSLGADADSAEVVEDFGVSVTHTPE